MTAPYAVHLDAGGRPRCGHRYARHLTADQARATCRDCTALAAGTYHGGMRWQRRLDMIEDYLFIGGDKMSAAKAAERLGVTARTIQRYRAELRRAA